MTDLRISSYITAAKSIGDEVEMHLEVFNLSNKAAFGGGLVCLDETQYFIKSTAALPSIARDDGKGGSRSSVLIKLTARCAGHKSLKDVDGKQRFTVYDRDGNIVHHQSFQMPMFSFCGRVLNLKPTKTSMGEFINILLFGIAGAGKSTFMNTVLTLFSDDYKIVTKANMGGATRHVTLTLTAYELTSKADGSKRELRFWDTWGLLPDTWQSDDLELLLKGTFPQNWAKEMTYDQKRVELEERKAVSSRIDRRIHCVMLFVPQQAIDNAEHLQVLQEAHERIAKLVPNPIVIVTKLDEVDATLRRDASTQSDVVKTTLADAAKKLNIPPNQVFHTVNYVEEDQKVFHIEKQLYRILEKACDVAIGNFESMPLANANAPAASSSSSFIW